jgi:hypothetical protein
MNWHAARHAGARRRGDARGCDGGVRKELARKLKMKNPEAPAVKREAEEEWGGGEVADASRQLHAR